MSVKRTTGDRCSTGIAGLDNILGGGLTKERIYLVQGEPGAGKTTLGLQFLLEGVKKGERGLYLTLSETKEELNQVAISHGWNLEQISILDLTAIEQSIPSDTTNSLFHPYEVELTQTTKVILNEVERLKPERVIFDSLSEMRMLTENPLRYRRQMLFLKQFFAKQNCTVLMLDDKTSSTARDLQISSIVHGVIELYHLAPEYGVERRRLAVLKIRGVSFKGGFHDFVIVSGGLIVFPRLVAADYKQEAVGPEVSSGVANIDKLLGGGIHRGTSTLFIGPAGCGKSTLCMQYATAAAERGEKVLLVLFEETLHILLSRAAGLGMPFKKFMESGNLRLMHVDAAEYSPGQLADVIQTAIREDGFKFVVIDSLNGYIAAMPEERFLILHMHELLTFLNSQGVATFMVLAQHGLVGSMQSPADLTYLADTVVLLRYFEAEGAIRQAISIMKKRSGFHERTIREMRIDEHGIHVDEPLTNFQGVLTGVPQIRESKTAVAQKNIL